MLAIIEQHLPLTAALPCVFLFAGVAARRRMLPRWFKAYRAYVLRCGVTGDASSSVWVFDVSKVGRPTGDVGCGHVVCFRAWANGGAPRCALEKALQVMMP